MIFFVIPIFNEADNLSLLAKNIGSIKIEDDYKVIIVDDGSMDDSHDVAVAVFADLNLVYLTNPKNSGPGFSFNNGFDYILNNYEIKQNDLIITMEGDNTSDIEILPTMILLARNNYDLVLASVYAQGGTIKNSNMFRKTLSLGANLLIRFVFDIKVLTMSSFYRVYSAKLVGKIRDEYSVCVRNNGFLSQIELLLKAIGVGAHIIEVPMVLDSSKRKGKSKMKVIKTAFDYFKFFIKHALNKNQFK